MPLPRSETVETAPTVVERWRARASVRDDLPSWVDAAVSLGGRTATRACPADHLRGSALTDAARTLFLSAIDELGASPCRVWAFLPRPTDRDDDALERYMRFNAGRAEAYSARADIVRVVPAGTCVGHAGDELVVHALAIDEPFASVENPRQRPAWRYSERYGPVPPTFSRASRMDTLLLASGTAAVLGEDSLHADDLEAQFEETLRNLASLADSGGGDGRWHSLQIYVRDAEDLSAAHALALRHFGGGVERVLHAPLCRSELLVEIEGVCHVAKPQA